MDSQDTATIAGMLVAQLVVLGTFILVAGRFLLGRIDATETRLRADVDNVSKQVQAAQLELATSLAHLTGRVDEFMRATGTASASS